MHVNIPFHFHSPYPLRNQLSTAVLPRDDYFTNAASYEQPCSHPFVDAEFVKAPLEVVKRIVQYHFLLTDA